MSGCAAHLQRGNIAPVFPDLFATLRGRRPRPRNSVAPRPYRPSWRWQEQEDFDAEAFFLAGDDGRRRCVASRQEQAQPGIPGQHLLRLQTVLRRKGTAWEMGTSSTGWETFPRCGDRRQGEVFAIYRYTMADAQERAAEALSYNSASWPESAAWPKATNALASSIESWSEKLQEQSFKDAMLPTRNPANGHPPRVRCGPQI